MEESIVGSLINFRGLVYSPINEQGVVFLFSRILEKLNMNIEEKKKLEGVEIIELKSLIKDPSFKNIEIKVPQKTMEKSEYDLEHHFKRKDVTKQAQELYHKLDGRIKAIDNEIFRKFSKTAITYYSPEKMFVFLGFRKNGIWIDRKSTRLNSSHMSISY